MRIRRLRVQNLRRYRELDIDLAPGLTIVRGPNEAGKSTIQRAIELALTRRVTSAAGDLDSLRSWDALDGAQTVVAIEFDQDEDGEIRTGTLEKTFAGSKGTVDLQYDGQSITDPALADQVLAELTGVPTEGFFRSTGSVRHMEVAGLARDEAALRDRLQASISGADRGTSFARKKLDKALHDLTTRGDKNPGRLKIAEQALAQAAASVEHGDLALAQLERDRDSLSGARERRGEAESSLVERRGLLEKARQAERLAAERDAAKERYDRFRRALEVSDEIATLATAHPSPNALPVLRQVVERLRVSDTRLRELRAMLSGEVDVQFEVAPESPWQLVSRFSIPLVIIGVLVTLAAVAGSASRVLDLGPIPLIVGLVVAGVGLVLAIVAIVMRRGSRMDTQLRDVEIDRRLRGRSDLEEEQLMLEADVKRQLESLGLDDLPAAEAMLTAETEHVATIDRLSAQLDGLVGKEPPVALPGMRDAAALEIEQKTSALEALGPVAKEPRARERLEVEVKGQETALESARDDEANARARVEANPVDAEQVAAQAERLAAWREQMATLERRQRVYALTLQSIDDAERATMKTVTRYLEKHMVGDLATVTDGRYRRVQVDDRTLDIEVMAPEKGDWVKVSSLSQGTLDLVYLTARLGLVRLVTGDRRPPLLMDDPFVSLDDARAMRALGLLKAIAADFQVIYMTTSDRYDSAADAVVELPGPTAKDDAASAATTGSST